MALFVYNQNQACGDCIYFMLSNSPKGHCRRYPPTIVDVTARDRSDFQPQSNWPMCLTTTKACGEYNDGGLL